MSLVRRDQISFEAIQKLVPELWGKPRLATVLLSWTDEVQILEDAIFSVIDGLLLDNAVGPQLALLGRVVGQPNFGWGDDDYRAAIRARIRASRSNGRMIDIKEVVELMTPGVPFKVTPGGNASVTLRWLAPPSVIFSALSQILAATRGAGVKIVAFAPEGVHSFTYRDRFDTSDPTLGWSHYSDVTGNGIYGHVEVI